MLDSLKEILINQSDQIQDWIDSKIIGLVPPIYLSCDIRHSGYKIAPVDTNLFPAGFNNLCDIYASASIDAFQGYFSKYYPDVKNVLLLAEEHTRNKFYLTNLSALEKLLIQAGLEVKTVMISDEIKESKTIELDDEVSIEIHPFIIENNHPIFQDGFNPDIILSNNDFSNGLPQSLENIDLEIIPHPKLGWHNRTKSGHFDHFENLVQEFAKEFNFDPWLLSAYHDKLESVDLTEENSRQALAQKVDQIISKIQSKYDEYKIEETPYVFIKSDNGTYGMGIMTATSGEDILNLNRKKRNKLLSSKSNSHRNHFFIQEGIPTSDFYSEQPIEPVIYAIGGKDIGGFFRINQSRNHLESLNAKGMSFSCLCLHKLNEPHEEYFIKCEEKEFVVFLSRFLTKLVSIAASFEGK